MLDPLAPSAGASGDVARAPLAGLPRIVEVKRTLGGAEKRFECGLLHVEGPHLVVLFVSTTPMRVHGVTLRAGTLTFGHFWRERPYNVYHWLDPQTGQTIGAYINLAAETRILGDRLEWLDLIVDVLALPGEPARVLDEDEVPADASPALRAQIATARAAVLGRLPQLLDELERSRARLWPSVQGRAAGPP